MRKLKQSENYSNRLFGQLLKDSRPNTSTKPYARFMHTLADTVFPAKPGLPRKFVFIAPQLSRAQRRATLHTNVCPAVQQVEAAPERKITGAVRRGLERGHVA
jgi:hypothetical protein